MVAIEAVRQSLTERIRTKLIQNQKHGDRDDHGHTDWKYYGMEIADYERSFSGVLEYNSIAGLLRDKKDAIIIDVMGPTSTVVSLIGKLQTKPKLGLAISLEDRRNIFRKIKDRAKNVRQISGDIMRPRTWEKVEKTLHGRKADLIMERAVSGFSCMPKDGKLYAMLMNKAWHILSNENGIFIAQVPDWFETSAQGMIEKFKAEGIDASIGLSTSDWKVSIKIIKHPNSPEKLPF